MRQGTDTPTRDLTDECVDPFEVLHRLGRVTSRQLAHLRQAGPGADLGIDPGEVAEAAGFHQAWVAAGGMAGFQVPPDLLPLVPPALALRHRILPLARVGGRLVVAVPADAPPGSLAPVLMRLPGGEPLTWAVDGPDLERGCHAFYDPHALRGALARALERGRPEADPERAPVTATRGDAPIVDLVDDLLLEAQDANASDIHLDPFEAGTVVRFRVDGILRDVLELPAAIAPAVVTRLKLLAQLNISERRHPQDGRFTAAVGADTVDVRLATTPTRHGELVVMRLLRPLRLNEGLGDLGLLPADLARYRRLVAAPNGILLVTGPTGSGKSTTLYGTLSAIDRVRRNVITIEDPIEYSIDRAMQIQVNAPIGLTFAAALRSVLRLDPNVILVGEIRDAETLEIAMHAAMTGHLVLSTLHANDAVTTFARLLELGGTTRQIAGSLLGVVAQRLVRRVCDACAEVEEADPVALAALGWATDAPTQLVRGRGCVRCGQTGYRGRVGVYEVLAMDDRLGQAVTAGEGIPALRTRAREAGMSTMWDDGRAKVLAGLTTPEEIARVARRT